MKKILFVLIVSALYINCSAQKKIISSGIKAGMNFSNATECISEIKDGSIKSRRAFVGGVFLEVRPLTSLSVSAEVLYSGQGYTASGTIEGNQVTEEVKLNYINVPILVNYYLIDGLAVKAGVQYGFNTKKDICLCGTQTEINDITKKADLGIPLGVSYNFKFGLIIDARYTFGVNDISVGSVGDVVLGKAKNRVFSLTLGYRF